MEIKKKQKEMFTSKGLLKISHRAWLKHPKDVKP
jgi:hypothetical protein